MSAFDQSLRSDFRLLTYSTTYVRVEKACKEFLTIFLQVLDEGRLTDGQGRLVDFRSV